MSFVVSFLVVVVLLCFFSLFPSHSHTNRGGGDVLEVCEIEAVQAAADADNHSLHLARGRTEPTDKGLVGDQTGSHLRLVPHREPPRKQRDSARAQPRPLGQSPQVMFLRVFLFVVSLPLAARSLFVVSLPLAARSLFVVSLPLCSVVVVSHLVSLPGLRRRGTKSS